MEPTSLTAVLNGITFLRGLKDRERASLERRIRTANEAALATHHSFVVNWARQFHSLAQMQSTGDPITLTYRSIPRRLGARHSTAFDEDDLILQDGHTAVLGDPGAGKTTTLRRIGYSIATDPAFGDLFQRVFVVVCRETQRRKRTLMEELGEAVGISGRLASELDNCAELLHHLLSNSLILVDGLDEIGHSKRREFETDLARLARSVSAKVIVSCRSGDWNQIDGFEVAEIQPLDAGQIRALVHTVLGPDESAEFIAAATDATSPTSDLANRPLFLAYMARLFQLRGAIPDRPSDLLRQIVRLVLREWDDDRGVRRESSYAKFDVDDKATFLAELAWELLEAGNLTQFSEHDLRVAFARMHTKFDLPASNERQVVREIESHNGLIISAGENYEFSHRSLHEYLAAEHVSRSTGILRHAFVSQPDVAAIAVALSTNSSKAIEDLSSTLKPNVQNEFIVRAFLARLGLERPRLSPSTTVGVALLTMIRQGVYKDPRPLKSLRECEPLKKSIMSAVKSFDNRALRPGRRVYLSDSLAFAEGVLETVIGKDTLRQMLAAPPSD